MHDIITMLLAAGLGGASCGFMAACLLLSHRMRRISIESWREARDHYTSEFHQDTGGPPVPLLTHDS